MSVDAYIREDGRKCFRINGYISTTLGGCYVEVPFDVDDPEMPLSLEQMHRLAADLQNGLDSLNWICDAPEEAAKCGAIPTADIGRILAIKKALADAAR